MTATTNTPPALDEDRLNALLGQAAGDFGATVNAALVVIGVRLGLYRQLAAAGHRQPADEVRQPREGGPLALGVLVQVVVELPRLVADPEGAPPR